MRTYQSGLADLGAFPRAGLTSFRVVGQDISRLKVICADTAPLTKLLAAWRE